MSYGFLDVTHASQRHGFFVDERDQIIFWPSGDPIGYVLSFSKAREIAELRYRHMNGLGLLVMGLVVVGLAMIGVVFIAFSDQQVFFGTFSKLPFICLLNTVPLVIVSLAYWVLYGRPRYRRALESALTGTDRVEEARPVVSFLKPSEMHGRKLWFACIVILGLAACSGAFAIILIESRHVLIGDVIVFFAISLLFGAVAINFIRLELTGCRLSEVRVFDAPV